MRSSEAAVLAAAPGGVRTAMRVESVVDPHHPGLHLPGKRFAALGIAGPDGGAESVWRVVGHGNCLSSVLHNDDGQHWSEDFLAGDFGVVIDGDENGRLIEEAAQIASS